MLSRINLGTANDYEGCSVSNEDIACIMRRTRALRILNVNPGSKQISSDSKTADAAFSCTQNDSTGNKCHLERTLKNSQLLKENKLMKQLKQETQVMQQQGASSSRFDPSLESPENSEFANINRTEEPDDLDYFPPTGLLYSSDMPDSSDTTATVENACEVSGTSASSSNNIVADLHEKLCNSLAQNQKRASRKRSQSADTDDGLPLLSTIVNEILSLEADFPLPSTSYSDTSDNISPAGWKKRCRRQYTRAPPKRKKKQRKSNGNSALLSSIPSTLVDDAASCTIPVISDNDSDCEITAYVPSNSQQMRASSEIDCRNALESNIYDLSVLELDRTPVPFVSEQNSGNANGTNMRLDSIINMLHDTVQRIDDDVVIIDTIPQGSSEDGTNLNRSVVEIGTISGESQLTPPVIVVSDDESEPAVEPALNKQLKTTVTGLSSSKGRKWECPICWEGLTSARGVCSTMCGHVYCNPCISHVLKTTKKCPICRKSLTKGKVHPLFLDEQ